MSTTERKLINVIAEHYLVENAGKITLEEVSRRAGISRQAFNQYYSHLKPYAQGRRSIAELLEAGNGESEIFLQKSQNLIARLNDEIRLLKSTRESEIDKVKSQYITSLMNTDISIHNAREVGVALEKQSLHNDLLIKKINDLESELNLKKSEIFLSKAGHAIKSGESPKMEIPIDLNLIYETFDKTGDLDVFEESKTIAFSKALDKARKIADPKDVVVIFIERYISNFKSFVAGHAGSSECTHYYLSLPVFSRIELKSLIKNSGLKVPVEVFIPFINSDSVRKSQRIFKFRGIPEIEFISADAMDFPSYKDGFTKVCFFEVAQGE